MGLFCKKCGLCQKRCQVQAISNTNGKYKIDRSKCIGCGACFSICPRHAVSIFSVGGFWNALFKGKFFREKLVEYACGSAKGKKHIYISFAVNITRGCDCEPHPMPRCIKDIGVFASTDPVAIDQACLDLVYSCDDPRKDHLIQRIESRNGVLTVEAAAELGMGSREYTLIEVE
jgi:uncharacterized Fe-S center protein